MEFKSKSRAQKQKQKQQFRIISGSIRSKSTTPTILCKKHPKHKQSPGVCAVCLREKLNLLPPLSSNTQKATKKTNADGSSSSSSLSSLSSHDSSNASTSCASPHHHRSYSSATFLTTGKKLFTNSRSMAAIVMPTRPQNMTAMDYQIKKKQGFWSKLLHPRKSKVTMV